MLSSLNWVLYSVLSVLWCCWLVGRKGIRPVKNEWWGASMVICLELGADSQIGFTFLVPAHLDSPGKRAVKWVCVLYSVFYHLTVKAVQWAVMLCGFEGNPWHYWHQYHTTQPGLTSITELWSCILKAVFMILTAICLCLHIEFCLQTISSWTWVSLYSHLHSSCASSKRQLCW